MKDKMKTLLRFRQNNGEIVNRHIQLEELLDLPIGHQITFLDTGENGIENGTYEVYGGPFDFFSFNRESPSYFERCYDLRYVEYVER